MSFHEASDGDKGGHKLTQLLSVNHFRTKRQAHNVSRQSDETWNPFRHVSWKAKRAETWNDRLEAQIEGNGATGEDLTHAATSPYPNNDHLRDISTSGTGQGTEEPAAKSEDSHDRPLINQQNELRNRGKGDQDETVNQTPVDAPETSKTKKPHKEGGLIRHVQPKEPFTVANQIQRTLLNSWINLLLIAAPVGIALNYIEAVDRKAVFVVNFLAIVPLAAMLSFATEEIALRTGETLGGLLNATFGNAVELIVAILALVDDKVAIVQTSLIGSILSNLLLVMGFCFFFGGLGRPEQNFNKTVAQTAASMLALAAASVIVPTVFDRAANTPTDNVAKLSRGTAVILLIVYGAYLFFQLKTHQEVFAAPSEKVERTPFRSASKAANVKQGLASSAQVGGILIGTEMANISDNKAEEEDEEEEPQLHFYVALGTLAASTAIIALCAEFMVGSIDAITKNGALSEEFVGLILLPIVGNAAEHATAVTVAIKDKMDLAIGVAVGSSMQVALFLIPLLVVIGWGMGKDEMNLSFDTFQVAVMFVAVLLVNYLIGDGKSHWLEGWLLICLYAIIAVCAFWYPDQIPDGTS
ncbi:Ca2+ transporter [Trichoderma barbatum]